MAQLRKTRLTACTSGFGAFGSAAARLLRSSAGSSPSTTCLHVIPHQTESANVVALLTAVIAAEAVMRTAIRLPARLGLLGLASR